MLPWIRVAGAAAGIAGAALIVWSGALPFWGAIAVAAVVFLVVPALLERAFRKAITDEERRRDLRDRVDNPPS